MKIKVRVHLFNDEHITYTHEVESFNQFNSIIFEELENDNEFIPLGSNSLINKCHIAAIMFDEIKD